MALDLLNTSTMPEVPIWNWQHICFYQRQR